MEKYETTPHMVAMMKRLSIVLFLYYTTDERQVPNVL